MYSGYMDVVVLVGVTPRLVVKKRNFASAMHNGYTDVVVLADVTARTVVKKRRLAVIYKLGHIRRVHVLIDERRTWNIVAVVVWIMVSRHPR